jgi:hypothetical protein
MALGGLRLTFTLVVLPTTTFLAGLSLPPVNLETIGRSLVQSIPFHTNASALFHKNNGSSWSTLIPLKDSLLIETVELYPISHPVSSLYATTPTSSEQHVETVMAWMNDASFSVTIPTDYMDLIPSTMKQVYMDYQNTKSFIRYLTTTSLEDMLTGAEDAATRRVNEFWADLIAVRLRLFHNALEQYANQSATGD